MRAVAIAPVALLAACSEEDVSNAISDWIKAALWFMAKMILISLGLMVAFAAALAIGGAFIAIGVRRRKGDVRTVGTIIVGTAVIAAAWPLVFTQAGLAGVLAPGSTDGVAGGPVFGVVLGVLAVVVALIVFLRKRDKRAAATANPPSSALAPPPSPPAPPAPPVPAPPSVLVPERSPEGPRPAARPRTAARPATKKGVAPKRRPPTAARKSATKTRAAKG